MRPLVAKAEISQQQFDSYVAAAKVTEAQVKAAQDRVQMSGQGIATARAAADAARARIQQMRAEVAQSTAGERQVLVTQAQAVSAGARVQGARADLAAAELNLSYTTIVASVEGEVTKKSVEPGQILQPGQALMALIPLKDVWVTANFKETQLADVRPGQTAEVHVDMYGRTIAGKVDSIAGGTGARMSLLPPENATGNYVKVVERIPVKIVFDSLPEGVISAPRHERGRNHHYPLRSGMDTSINSTATGVSINPWIIAMTVMLATFMEVLDTSVANVALPHIAGSLSSSVDEATWVLTSYLVSNAIVLPLSGWFSSIFGRKRFYMSCVALFTLSSMLCGLAPSLTVLIICRILQGIGGGALQPISQAILVESFPRHKQGMAMAVYGMGVVVAPVIGPTLGGWITDNYSWRWIFLINIPIGALSLTLTSLLIADPPYLVRRALHGLRVDYIGLGLLTLGLAALEITLDDGKKNDWF